MKTSKEDFKTQIFGGLVICIIFTPFIGVPWMIINYLMLKKEGV